MIEGLAACFTGLEDPRETRRCDHQLIDILVIAVCAVIACAESWEDIALYGRSKRAWLETFLALPNGIPSHDWASPCGVEGSVRNPSTPGGWYGRKADPKALYARVQ